MGSLHVEEVRTDTTEGRSGEGGEATLLLPTVPALSKLMFAPILGSTPWRMHEHGIRMVPGLQS